jgi:hypothetical protein
LFSETNSCKGWRIIILKLWCKTAKKYREVSAEYENQFPGIYCSINNTREIKSSVKQETSQMPKHTLNSYIK